MTPKPRHPLRRISQKKLDSLGGIAPRSTVPRNAKKKREAKPKWLLPEVRQSQAEKERREWERKYGPALFVKFLHASQCLCCGVAGDMIQQAHRFTGGTGRKGRWQDTIPLCGPRFGFRGCHQSYDLAKQTWSRDHNLPARAAWFWQTWEDFCERASPDSPLG